MAIDLYCLMASPPARAVMIVARRLGVQLNIVEVDMMSGQHQSEEYAQMNPRKTVPALNDNGYFLGESRAIMMYLANQYAPTHALYPSDAKKRGQVDRALFLSAEVYEAAKLNILRPLVYEGKKITPDAYTHFYTLMGAVDTLIGSNGYVAGSAVTIADISLFVDLCYLRDVPCIDFSKFCKLFIFPLINQGLFLNFRQIQKRT